MITKPPKIIKRIVKAVGQRQSVLVIGEWQEELIKGIKENQNSIQHSAFSFRLSGLQGDSFTRVVVDYSDVIARKDEVLTKQSHITKNSGNVNHVQRSEIASVASLPRNDSFYKEARRLLLPTGMLIISADCEESIFEKITKLFKKKSAYIKEGVRVKPKVLQDLIHDNGFLIDGYYGYPGGHLLMMAQIQNKEVTTLFASDKQETIVN